MLSHQLMAGLGLSILWINALLIAGAALRELAALRARRARLAGPLLRGRVEQGLGPDRAFATHTVEQVGRAADVRSGIAIHFSDRAYRSTIHGGTLALADGSRHTVPPSDDARSEVWIAPTEADAPPGDAALERAWSEAKQSRGFARSLDRSIREQATIAVALPREEGEATWVFDERFARDWLARREGLAALFIVLELAALAGATAVCFVGGSFESVVTKVGGALCVAWFLGVQPIGVALSEACRPLHRAPVRGAWRRP
ncbi:MAG: hypothetical protein JNK05_24635 [Myxococcales bacterium]|nr:hypothetical protein [Myxococcales bacterium]